MGEEQELGSVGLQASPVSPSPSLAGGVATPSYAALQERVRALESACNVHASDCSVYNEPAQPRGPCDCWLSEARRLIDYEGPWPPDAEDYERFGSRYGMELLAIADRVSEALHMPKNGRQALARRK